MRVFDMMALIVTCALGLLIGLVLFFLVRELGLLLAILTPLGPVDGVAILSSVAVFWNLLSLLPAAKRKTIKDLLDGED